MKPKSRPFFSLLTLLIFASLACSFGRSTPTQPPTAATAIPAATPQKTASPSPTAPAITLDEEQRSEEGGFAFRPVPGYELESMEGIVSMEAPDADPEYGPVLSLIGSLNDTPKTLEDLIEWINQGGETEISEPRPITVAGIAGQEMDMSRDGGALMGRVAVVMVTPTQQFVMIAGAPSERWESEMLPYYQAVLESVSFFEPAETAHPAGPDRPQVDAEIRQWASSAIASSEYGSIDWSAAQATGAPDTLTCSDQETAWAAANSNTEEWIELTYAVPVIPTQINVHITYNPTFITKIELFDTYGEYHQVYSFEARPYPECPYIFSVDVTDDDYQAAGMKITIDQSAAPSWVEIDAVELVGLGNVSDAAQPPDPPSAESSPGKTTFPTPEGFLWRAGGPFGFEEGQYPGLYGMDFDDDSGLLYVADSIRSIRVFDQDGRAVGEITDSEMSVPDDVKIGPDGNLYVAAWGSDKIYVFSPAGKLLHSFGEHGAGDGQFGDFSPDRLAVGPEGNVYVLDGNKDSAGQSIERIQVFTSEGKYLHTLSYPDELFLCGGMDVGPDGDLYVVGFVGARILHYSPDGTLVGELGADTLSGMGSAQALALDEDGSFYLALWTTGMVKLDPDGKLIGTWGVEVQDGTLDWSEGGFYQQGGIAVAADGSRIFFSDTSSQYAYLTAFSYP